ncbi:MAG: hypothetical protein ACNYPD_01360 [Candidatus Halichondribacter symbioticus]
MIIEILTAISSTTIAALLVAAFSIRQVFTKIRPKPEKEELIADFDLGIEAILVKIKAEEDKQKKKALEEQKQRLLQDYQSKISSNLQKADGSFVTEWREVLLVTRNRLLDEEKNLRARNYVNIRVGVIIAFLGFYCLLIFVVGSVYVFISSASDVTNSALILPNSVLSLPNSTLRLPNNVWEFLMLYGPTLSAIAIIEVLAIFFLNLYASNERRLERNKSDLTNIELRLTSGLMLYEKVNKDKFAILADNISKEDSNFILGKNETSGGSGTNKILETVLKTATKAGE